MRITNLKWFAVAGILVVALSACNSSASQTSSAPTRVATQTPWIIYVPVTVTPEPATVTPLPTADLKTGPTRTPTRSAAVAIRPTASPTKPKTVAPVAPVAPVAAASPTPSCNLGTVKLIEPEDGTTRHTKEVGVGGDTFRFIFEPPASLIGGGDPSVGYQIQMASKRGGFGNGATVYVSNTKFLNDGKIFIFDKPGVSALAGGDNVTVTWNVTIVKTTGGFNDNDPSVRPLGLITCGPPSPTWKINLEVF